MSPCLGVATLARKRVSVLWMRARVVAWRPYGWAQVILALSVALEVMPILAHVPAGVRVVVSLAALTQLSDNRGSPRSALGYCPRNIQARATAKPTTNASMGLCDFK
jgi:hypothetical protein